MGNFSYFLRLFSRIFRRSEEFLANFHGSMSGCAVGVPADSVTVVGQPAIACLPSAVDVCDVPIVSAAVAGVPAEYCWLLYCLFWRSYC